MTISFAQFNPHADAQQVFDGVMTAGSAVLTSASGKFSASDVGKMIHVQGAGPSNLKLVSTILSYQSPTQVTLATAASFSISPATSASGSGVTWGTDDGPTFQAAINAINDGETLYIPTGNYLLSTPVYRDFNLVSPLHMYGDGWGTRIYAAAYNPTTPTSHQSVSLFTVENLTHFELSNMLFIGTPSAKVDFRFLFVLSQITLAKVDADFYWLSPLGPTGGNGGVIWSFGTNLRLNSRFRGCIGGDIVWNSSWRGFVDEGSFFIDWGIIDGFYSTKYTSGSPNSWVRISAPLQTVATKSAHLGQSKIIFQNTTLDEDGGIPILVDAALDAIHAIDIDGVNINGPATASTPSIKISGVQLVTINAWIGYNTTVINDAIMLSNVNIAYLRHVEARQLSNRISADSTVGTLIVEDCNYTTLNSSAQQTIIRSARDGAGSRTLA